MTVYRANNLVSKMVGIHKLQDFIFIHSEKTSKLKHKNPASKVTVMFLPSCYHKIINIKKMEKKDISTSTYILSFFLMVFFSSINILWTNQIYKLFNWKN